MAGGEYVFDAGLAHASASVSSPSSSAVGIEAMRGHAGHAGMQMVLRVQNPGCSVKEPLINTANNGVIVM